MSIDKDQGFDKQERLLFVKLWVSLFIVTFIGMLNPFAFVPGFDGQQVHLLYAHAFIIILFARRALPIWAYVIAQFVFDLIYGFPAFNIPVIAVFCMVLGYLRLKNLSWGFAASWAIFSLFILAFEALRYILMGVFLPMDLSLISFTRGMAAHICLYPFVYFGLKSFVKSQ